MNEIKNFFKPIDLPEREQRYHFLSQTGTVMPAIIFACLSISFWVKEVPILFELGIVVVLVMMGISYLVHSRKYLVASSLNVLMHLVFLGTGIVIVGWESGLQYHFIAMSFVTQFNQKGNHRYKLGLGAICALAFLISAGYTSTHAPLFPLTKSFADSLLFFNISFALPVFVVLNNFGQTLEKAEENMVQSSLENEKLLHSILPIEVSKELQETGSVQPARFEDTTIFFSDFQGFTNIVASIPTKKLITELNEIFCEFDDIMDSEGIEKIQTVGDAYLAACGLPIPVSDHAVRCVRAAKKILIFLDKRNETHAIKWKIRIGLHSGPISAGVTGKKKFAYDIFGDTINTASRIESNGEEGKINVSAYTYDLIKGDFDCEYRGKINAKGKGELDMYFVA